jgi:hypothetical protein
MTCLLFLPLQFREGNLLLIAQLWDGKGMPKMHMTLEEQEMNFDGME